jgi:hypothetical protein
MPRNRKIIAVILAVVIGAFVAVDHFPIRTVAAFRSLPNSHSFHLPVAIVRSRILDGLQTAKERDDPFYRKYGFAEPELNEFTPFLAEEKSSAIFGKGFFADAANSDDIYVHSMGAAVVSSYYHPLGGGMMYSVQFSISVKSEDDDNTMVTVRSFDTAIYDGTEFNGHALWFVPKRKAVPPARAEEYKLLTYVAHLLGTQMPMIVTGQDHLMPLTVDANLAHATLP